MDNLSMLWFFYDSGEQNTYVDPCYPQGFSSWKTKIASLRPFFVRSPKVSETDELCFSCLWKLF